VDDEDLEDDEDGDVSTGVKLHGPGELPAGSGVKLHGPGPVPQPQTQPATTP